jgi:uncharacterized membrane protein YccC
MIFPVHLLLLFVAGLLGGIVVSALVLQFLQPAAGILSPFLLIGLAMLVAALGYALSVWRNPPRL